MVQKRRAHHLERIKTIPFHKINQRAIERLCQIGQPHQAAYIAHLERLVQPARSIQRKAEMHRSAGAVIKCEMPGCICIEQLQECSSEP